MQRSGYDLPVYASQVQETFVFTIESPLLSRDEVNEHRLLEELLAAQEAFQQCAEDEKPEAKQRLEEAGIKLLEFCCMSSGQRL
jgi:hypothetical protein